MNNSRPSTEPVRQRLQPALIATLAALLFPVSALASQASAVTLQTLLTEMVDFDSVARWPAPPFTVRQASSYDRSRTAPDKPGWFANNDKSNYIRTDTVDGHPQHVLMDADGPGAIVRFFVTTGGPRKGHFRIFLDSADQPAIDFTELDLLKSDLKIDPPLVLRHPAPLGHGGGTFYLPVPYASHCKVTLEEADESRADSRYYHVDYRTYPAGTSVETFTRANLETVRPDVERVNKLLVDPPVPRTTAEAGFEGALDPGAKKSAELPGGPSAVRQIEISVAAGLSPAAREQALRSVVIRATFDYESETIWCPVGDFNGSGAGGRPVSSWYRSVDDKGDAVCRWTMPYQKHGTISLENLGTFAVPVKLRARVGPWAWDDRSMYFHANWHQQVRIPTRPFRDWNFATLTGRGVLVGDVMSVYNPVPAWYGEGNEKIWVDGESFPSHLGTGTEDYYNASWAPNPVFQGPFSNHPRIDGAQSQGQNVYTRSRNLDAIPFEKSLQFDFEIETWQDSLVDYAGTTYWYGSPGARSNRAPEPDEARRPVPALPAVMAIPNAVECESLKIANRNKGLAVEVQDMQGFRGTWSNGAQLLIRGKQAGDFIELTIPVDGAAPRRVTLYATQARDYGILKFSVNSQEVTDHFDGYAVDPTPSAAIPLGVFEPKDGKLILRAQLVGTNPQTSGAKFFAGLDAVVVSDQ